MSTGIEWTEDTWNPTTGCTKLSAGCANCYIERTPPFRIAGRKFVHGDIPLQFHADRLDAPLHWKKPRRVFVNSMSDLFHEDVPDEFIDRVFAVMALCPQHTFQVLTKRAERMRDYMVALDRAIRLPTNPFPRWRSEAEEILSVRGDTTTIVTAIWPLPNAWLGVSVENQHFADERIPLLLEMPAVVRFVSCEPLLGPVDLQEFVPGYSWLRSEHPMDAPLDWVIVGGESGPQARPCDVAWVRSIVAQCKAAGVPVFVKQLGAAPFYRTGEPFNGPQQLHSDGERLRNRKGGDPAEWPVDLRVREFPVGQEGTK